MKSWLHILLSSASLLSASVCAGADFFGMEIKGKADLGLAVARVDISEDTDVIATYRNLTGPRGNATLVAKNGFCLKPGGMHVRNGANELYAFSMGAGWYIPLPKNLSITPYGGYSWGGMNCTLDYPLTIQGQQGPQNILLSGARQHSHSVGPFTAIDLGWKFHDKWMISGVWQYSWIKVCSSMTHNTFTNLIGSRTARTKARSFGPNYAIMLDYFLSPEWTVSAAYGYQLNENQEKNGLKAEGYRLAIGRVF